MRLLLFIALTFLCVPAKSQENVRAAWIATVYRLNWPKSSNEVVQKREAIRILDRMEELSMNLAVLQVRPTGDAFYQSNFEPWSRYLMGREGRAPNYDPLQFWIDEGKKRGIEIHAWFNPYRSMSAKKGITRKVGKYQWQIPTSLESQQHTLNVIMDVVRNYDIAGVHLDDYFYPYTGNYPDSDLYSEYRSNGGTKSKSDWRRYGVDTLVYSIHWNIKNEGHDVQFGISPFGIWRPNNPRGISGMDAYSKIYADSRKWIREGWVDYLCPQLYWTTEAQSFTRLLDWWKEQNVKDKYIWAGIKGVRESQIEHAGKEGVGVCIFSISSLMKRGVRSWENQP